MLYLYTLFKSTARIYSARIKKKKIKKKQTHAHFILPYMMPGNIRFINARGVCVFLHLFLDNSAVLSPSFLTRLENQKTLEHYLAGRYFLQLVERCRKHRHSRYCLRDCEFLLMNYDTIHYFAILTCLYIYTYVQLLLEFLLIVCAN